MLANIDILILIIVLILLVVFVKFYFRKSNLIDVNAYKKSKVLTKNEEIFFKKLHKAIGDKFFIFAQVPFSCLLKAKNSKDRSLFWKINQKRVDFVLLDNNLNSICIIELDDKSHKKKNKIDANRDKLFANCSIPTLRFSAYDENNPEYIRKQILRILNFF